MFLLLLILFKIFYLFIILLLKNWCSMEFDTFGLSVKDLSTWNMITRCNSSDPLYMIRLPSHSALSLHPTAPLALVASTSTCHRRLGHLDVDVLSKLSHDSSPICSRRTHDLCNTCQLCRHTRLPFVNSTSPTDNNFDLWTSPIDSIYDYNII
jgi:hypothetical protein